MKYKAIKLDGIDHWLWFETNRTIEQYGKFIGKGGRGKGGAFTELSVDSRLIVGIIETDELQYN